MKPIPRLALYQPDIPQNAGTLIRLSACLGFGLDVIEPCGFLWDDKRMRRAGMDYVEQAQVARHVSWAAFLSYMQEEGRRLVLLTTAGGEDFSRFSFSGQDVIMVGRESVGVPAIVAEAARHRVRIPMRAGVRSLNVALAATLAMGEALRQVGAFPEEDGR
jgi:tRNA (cytidine/uridine-2'-O-)-methyltransferase